MRFLVIHNAALKKLIEGHNKYGVTTMVTACEAAYDSTVAGKAGIHVLDWPFHDGAPLSNQIVVDWLSLRKSEFCEEPECSFCCSLHCAPVLVALALIEGGIK